MRDHTKAELYPLSIFDLVEGREYFRESNTNNTKQRMKKYFRKGNQMFQILGDETSLCNFLRTNDMFCYADLPAGVRIAPLYRSTGFATDRGNG